MIGFNFLLNSFAHREKKKKIFIQTQPKEGYFHMQSCLCDTNYYRNCKKRWSWGGSGLNV